MTMGVVHSVQWQQFALANLLAFLLPTLNFLVSLKPNINTFLREASLESVRLKSWHIVLSSAD